MSLAIPFNKFWGATYGSAPISVADTTAVKIADAAADGVRELWVLAFLFTSTAENSIALEDEDGNVLVGPCPTAATGGIVAPYNPVGWCRVPAGKDLYMDNSAADSVGGVVVYAYVTSL